MRSRMTASAPLFVPSDVTMKVKGVGCDDARTRGAVSGQFEAPRARPGGRVRGRVPLLYPAVTANRSARSRAASARLKPRAWAHRSRTFPLAPHEASKQ